MRPGRAAAGFLALALSVVVHAQPMPVEPEFRVNTYTSGYQSQPRVCRNAAGDFVVVLVSRGQDGSAGGIFGQRYDRVGAAQGGEFQVNDYTTGPQERPAVAWDPAGGVERGGVGGGRRRRW